jgi:protein TonB
MEYVPSCRGHFLFAVVFGNSIIYVFCFPELIAYYFNHMKITPLLFLLILSLHGISQEKEAFYVFDADWKPTKIESARFFLHTHTVSDSCWQWDFYNFMGPLLKTEQYKNREGGEKDGVCYYFNKQGNMDSSTNYLKGKKNGDSWKLDETLKKRMVYKYRNDSLIEVIDESKKNKDSAISYKDEKESEFPGGLPAWARYLTKHLAYPERAINNSMRGQVDVLFIVDKSGNVTNSCISKSVEYSLDDEALKIIKNSGRWDPAFQNGHNVKSYKKQPINFRLE